MDWVALALVASGVVCLAIGVGLGLALGDTDRERLAERVEQLQREHDRLAVALRDAEEVAAHLARHVGAADPRALVDGLLSGGNPPAGPGRPDSRAETSG